MSLLRRRLHTQGLTIRGARVRHAAGAGESRVVWRFSDTRAGHDSQSLGLLDALKRRLPINSFDIPVSPGAGLDWFRGEFQPGSLLPDPWLLIGAGHSTHLPLLAARRARGGRAVVLMKPDLPKRCFDLCVIPDHDRPRLAPNVLATRGSLNRMQAGVNTADTGHNRRGLLMIGGPSRHYHWNHEQVVEQLAGVIRYSPVRHWVLTTSRRTPPGFAEHVRDMIFNRNLEFTLHSWRDTPGRWLALQLERACCTWVTEDSVSMIYEALTAAIPVGLLSVPPRRQDRIVRGVQALVASGNVMRFSHWSRGIPLPRSVEIFDEANRVAERICTCWGRTSSSP
ncbi:MAG: ELM1/GtrOC1 family putative glycosyltransferase [Pseudomonadota bacterium]